LPFKLSGASFKKSRNLVPTVPYLLLREKVNPSPGGEVAAIGRCVRGPCGSQQPLGCGFAALRYLIPKPKD
jgi:hypothetical protein